MADDRRKILRAIQRESRKIRDPQARAKFRRAAVQTGIVESGLRNLSYGDADSQGWRQERASLYKDPTNITASVRRFRQEFQQHYDPGEASYDVAAQVQRPREDLRGRYREVAGQAARIVQSELGGGGAPNTNEGAGSTYRTRTTPGVDRSADRQALKLQYLENSHDPDALLNLGLSLRDAQDTPSTSTRYKVPAGKGRTRPRGSDKSVKGLGKGPLHELFYGQTSFDNGKPAAPVPGHDDHAHVAAEPKEVIRLGKLAQRMGLHVGENPAFDKVDPVHTQGSFHYRKRAIDVSGDPKKLRRYVKRVRRLYGL